MKNCNALCSLLLALVLLCSMNVAALADTPPDLIDPPVLSSSQMEVESAPVEPLPQVSDITPGPDEQEQPESDQSEPDLSSQPEAPEDEREQDAQEEEAPAPRGSNTPYFVGAVIAVLVFIGVALYCKYNGRK